VVPKGVPEETQIGEGARLIKRNCVRGLWC